MTAQPKSGPGYEMTRQIMWPSFFLSWLVILAIVAGGLFGQSQAVDLANIVVPSMVALIAALLGIHRWTGSRDFRALHALPREPPEGE
jgi:hypothetical protein